MSNETQNNRIYYLYRVTNKINNKIYIGQTVKPSARWWQHKHDAIDPKIPFHYAINKYGADNFEFEIIATCKSQNDANYIETELVKQYESHISTGKGYNATHGGMNAPKTEEFKQMMKKWHASLSTEERAKISQKQSEATIKQIAEHGHPAQGNKWTEEQRIKLSETLKALDKDAIYTPEVRKRMSEAHIGFKQSPETIIKRTESIKETCNQKRQKLINAGELKCNVPECEIFGQADYRIINDVRYCMKHGLRILRHGNTDKLPMHVQNNKSEEERKKCGLANIGRVAHNRKYFEPGQIEYILTCGKSMKALSREFNVTEKVIKRIKDGKY